MPGRSFYWVDAFTERSLRGNPCAVVLDADGMDEGLMQAVAVEMGLSETAFVLRPRRGDARARYFTVNGEIPMAGHPTVATLFALVDAGRLRLDGECTRVTLELAAGPMEVELLADGDRLAAIVMTQRTPEFLHEQDPKAALAALGLEPADGLPGVPVQVVSTGTPQLMVPVADLERLRRVRVQPEAYAALHAGGGFFSCHAFCAEGVEGEGATFARHFAGPRGAVEDPFTGSATGAMAAYLWRYGLLDSPRFVAQQGHWMGRPGEAGVEVVGPADAIEAVRVAGAGRVLVRGRIDL